VSFDKRSNNLPKVFHVNWFRQNDKGEFMWPGFGENIRVLEWILKRAKGQGEAVRSPIGYIPKNGAVNTQGLDLEPQTMEELCDVKPQGWQEELDHIESFWKNFEPQIPGELKQELSNIRQELHS
jgi:phosphoenolpyruvate carboxykinase (GTP)